MKKTLVLICLGLLTASPLEASTILLNPTDDKNVRDVNNDQVGDTLGPEPDGFLRVFGTATFFRAAIEFNIAAIPTGSTITSAVLRLQDGGTTSVPFTISLHGFAGDGAVSIADANTTNLVGSFSNPADAGSPLYVVDLTTFIQSLVTNGDPFAGVALRSSSEGTGLFRGADIDSEDFGVASSRPLLTVEFEQAASVPEPASLALLGTGFAYLTARRKKLRRH